MPSRWPGDTVAARAPCATRWPRARRSWTSTLAIRGGRLIKTASHWCGWLASLGTVERGRTSAPTATFAPGWMGEVQFLIRSKLSPILGSMLAPLVTPPPPSLPYTPPNSRARSASGVTTTTPCRLNVGSWDLGAWRHCLPCLCLVTTEANTPSCSPNNLCHLPQATILVSRWNVQGTIYGNTGGSLCYLFGNEDVANRA